MAGQASSESRSAKRLGAAVPVLLVCVLVLNLLDAVFTTGYLKAGLATEANPLMRFAWNLSPWIFFAGKLLMVGVGLAILWGQRHRAIALRALQAAVAIYAAVLVLHLSNLGRLLPLVAAGLR